MKTFLKEKVKHLKSETYMLYLAYKDPRVPWYAKAFIIATVGYALSPVDLIPDFIPVLGFLDDLIIIPLGIYLSIKMIPKEVFEECRGKVKTEPINVKSKWIMALTISFIWLIAAIFILKSVMEIVL